jgi:secreted protein with Ig-like and vWFA domain
MEAVKKVPDARVQGRASRLILFTSGVDETPATPRTMVLDALRTAKAKGIEVDVVGLGDTVPVDAYSDIASATGGKYIPAPDPATLARALTRLLTPKG